MRRAVRFLTAGLLAAALTLALAPADTWAIYDEITVKAGYYGYPYVTMGQFTADELLNSGYAYTELFTYYDRGGRAVYSECEGIPLIDLMAMADIDVEDIRRFNIVVFDGRYAGQDLTKEFLLDTPRYKYPDIAEYYDHNNAGGFKDAAKAEEDHQPVETMVAINNNWIRVNEMYLTETDESLFDSLIDECSREGRNCFIDPKTGALRYVENHFFYFREKGLETGDYPELNANARFRLELGQPSITSSTAGYSAVGMSEIDVTMNGVPDIEADKKLTLAVGEDDQIRYAVTSFDAAYSDLIRSGIRFESSDPTIIRVDETGKVTALREGEAVIHIYHEREDATVSQPLEAFVRVSTFQGEEEAGPVTPKPTPPAEEPETVCTVTYRDGAGGSVFADKTFRVSYGAATPAFGADPVRDGYTFDGWEPEVSQAVLEDVVYTAVWSEEKDAGSGTSEGSGTSTGGQGGSNAGKAASEKTGEKAEQTSGRQDATGETPASDIEYVYEEEPALTEVLEEEPPKETSTASVHQLYMNDAGGAGTAGAAAEAGGNNGGTKPLYIEVESDETGRKIVFLAAAFVALGMVCMYIRSRKEFGR